MMAETTQEPARDTYVLRLFVTGMTPRSTRAISVLTELCREHLRGRCELTVIDLYEHPALAKAEQIIATPTLIKQFPDPRRLFVGDLSDKSRILQGLGISPS